MKHSLATLLLLGLLPTTLYGVEPGHRFMSVQWENDGFIEQHDNNYTHGLEVSGAYLMPPPPWLASLASRFPLYRRNGEFDLINYSIGQRIFTPADKSSEALVVDDRPYAAHLFVTASLESLMERNGSYDSGNALQLTVGIVGPAAMGEETQQLAHSLIGQGNPNGWGNQLENEPTLGISYTRIWRIIRPASAGLEYGLTPHYTLALGNDHSYAAAGVTLRLGDNLRRDLSPPDINPGFPGLSYFGMAQETNWYGFIGLQGRWVAHNIFLDGNSFGDGHSVEKEPLVGDMQYGIAVLFGGVRIAISNVVRTREFTLQQEDTLHTALNISYCY